MKLGRAETAARDRHRAARCPNDSIEAGRGRACTWAPLPKCPPLAKHPAVVRDIRPSPKACSSPPARNCATWQRSAATSCRRPAALTIRDPSWNACNKRNPGSGCAAINGYNRNHAVLGVDESCIAQYPGDFAVALVALDAQVELSGPQGRRRMPFADLHRPPDHRPHIETTLRPGKSLPLSRFRPAHGTAARCI
jgi:xanthine dehydrogenase YagS FAD-binding subunit